jgi:hypothetical protein
MHRLLISLVVSALASVACAADDPNASSWATWSLFNGDQYQHRVGWTQEHFEVGFEVGYRDDIALDDASAYTAGLYGLYIVNPEAQFPIRGWIPSDLAFLPEFIPISLYVGTKCDFAFEEHRLLPAFVLGGYVRTGAHGSVGVEWQHGFTKWENTMALQDADVFMATLRIRF